MRLNFRTPLLALLVLAVAVVSWPRPAAAQVAEDRISADVQVVRDGGIWTAEFHFRQDAPAWAFTQSGLTRDDGAPWRPRAWTVETPGVRLERRGFYDVLVAADGGDVPRRVRVRFTPFAGDLRAEYDPALVFTSGAVALYSDQFDVFAQPSAAAVAALPADLNGQDLGAWAARVVWRDQAGPVLYRGERQAEAVTVGGQTYVLFGQADLVDTAQLATIVDPALPDWIGAQLPAFTPRLLALYQSELGPREGPKPMIMVSWGGPTPGLRSMGGSVLPGLIILSYEGEVLSRPDPEVLGAGQWFLAHEAAHLWLGQVVRYERVRDMWITEGGADLLAIRALERLVPGYDARAALQAGMDRCIDLAGREAIAPMHERGAHDVYYACGAVFGLIGEAAGPGDAFDFTRDLIRAAGEDRVLARAEWLGELTRRSGDPALAEGLARMLDEGVADPAAHLAGLLDRAGVRFERDAAGRVVLH